MQLDQVLPQLNTGCKIIFIPEFKGHKINKCSRHIISYDIQPHLEKHIPYVNKPCLHNELQSAVYRQMSLTPQPTARGKLLMRRALRLFKRGTKPNIRRWSMEDMVESYRKKSPRHYKRYRAALDEYYRRGLCSRDYSIQAFVKRERMRKVGKDPRMISARGTLFNLLLGTFTKPLDKWFYKWTGIGKSFTGLPVIGKGMNNSELGELHVKKCEAFQDVRVLSVDFSRFDKHVNKHLLRMEHNVYKYLFRGDRELSYLLSKQLTNKIRTQGGIKYVVEGGRMSGDMNTALGNCVIVCFIWGVLLRELKVDFDLLDNGDDCLIYLESKDYETVRKFLVSEAHHFGMVATVESENTDPFGVEWCQCRCIRTITGPKFVRNLDKAVSCVGVSINTNSEREDVDYIHTVGLCELANNAGVPVLQEFARALMRNTPGGKLRKSDVYYNMKEIGLEGKALPICEEARLDFMNAFGMTPSEQIYVEERLSAASFSVRSAKRGVGARYIRPLSIDYVKTKETSQFEETGQKFPNPCARSTSRSCKAHCGEEAT